MDIDFLNNCKKLGLYPKFLIFKLLNVYNKDALSIRKRLLHSTINKRNKELQHLSKELSLSVNFLSTQLSTIEFYILTNSITSFEKIHRSFLNNLKSEETKSQIRAHLSYLANSYFYNYKPSPRILRQHRDLGNLRKNKDIVITKPDKGNGVVILHQKLYNNVIEETISDSCKFEKLNEDPTLKHEASLQRFLRVETKKLFS